MKPHCRFPRLFAAVVEAVQGFTLTVYLRTSSYGDGILLLVNDPTDTIDEARAVIDKIARERSIEEPPWIDFHMSDRRPSNAFVH